MDLEINRAEPKIMHIDLNSCFARVEQQANPLLRGKVVVVAAYKSPGGCIVSPSVEAKKVGIRVGDNVRSACEKYAKVIVLTPDPAKYRDVHLKFKKIFRSYSPCVTPKSIDEAIIDFTTDTNQKKDMRDIALDIKTRMSREIGEWIICNIGIAPNRFLAKLAASLHKPDGLDIITHENLLETYRKIDLLDLCGINIKLKTRLNIEGIYTPLDFYRAPLFKLWKQVFRSIAGYYWYMRLRGFEVDEVQFLRKSFGQSYALGEKTRDPKKLARLLMKLTEKMGRRLRAANHIARGVHVAITHEDYEFYHRGKVFEAELYTTAELYSKAQLLFNQDSIKSRIVKIDISCFDLHPAQSAQLNLFSDDFLKKRKLAQSVDKINDKYGEFVITPATIMAMDKLVLDRIAFGGVKDLEDT